MLRSGGRDERPPTAPGARGAIYRLISYRGNPYIGSFHSTPREGAGTYTAASMLLEARRNPFLGTFRHSPSIAATSGLGGLGGLGALLRDVKTPTTPLASSSSGGGLGLDKLLYNDGKRPVVSQVQLSLDKHQRGEASRSSGRGHGHGRASRASPALLSGIPITRYMACPAVFRDELPHCAVCLDAFSDGDELRTLSCGHCYHRRCIDHWLLGCTCDEAATCPQCRQPVSPLLPPMAEAADTGEVLEDVTPGVSSSLTLPSVPSDLSLAHTHTHTRTSSDVAADDLIPSDSYLRIGAYLSSVEIGVSDTLFDQVHQHPHEQGSPTSALGEAGDDSDGDLTEISLRTILCRLDRDRDRDRDRKLIDPAAAAPKGPVALAAAVAIFSAPPVFESSYVFITSDS